MILTGYHGCDLSLAKAVVNGSSRLAASHNDYDWLGAGTYFWVNAPSRALEWSKYKFAKGHISAPAVIEMTIDAGNCLNCLDVNAAAEVRTMYDKVVELYQSAGEPLPVNSAVVDGFPLHRRLDCAVFDSIHYFRRIHRKSPYDTVLAAFEEGKPIFPGSGIREKSHVQIAVAPASGHLLSNPSIWWEPPP